MFSDNSAASQARLTITLGPGQRAALEEIASRNDATLAFVVRYALRRFIEESGQGRLPLEFPSAVIETPNSLRES